MLLPGLAMLIILTLPAVVTQKHRMLLCLCRNLQEAKLSLG